MVKNPRKSFHTDSVKKTIMINASKEKVWRKISNISGLPSWVIDVRKTIYLQKKEETQGQYVKLYLQMVKLLKNI